MSTPHERFQALRTLLCAIAGRNNLAGTDFRYIRIGAPTDIAADGEQVGGRVVSFFITHDALGKIMDSDVSEAMDVLDE